MRPGDVTRGPGLRILAREDADDVLGLATPTHDAGRQEQDGVVIALEALPDVLQMSARAR